MKKNDAAATLADLRALRRVARRRLYRRSRLERYRAELVALKTAGATYLDLQIWLRREHRCRVAVSTIYRYIKQLPEMTGIHRR